MASEITSRSLFDTNAIGVPATDWSWKYGYAADAASATEAVVVCGYLLSCDVALSLTINETLKWLSSLPVFMQESFWW